MTAKSLVQSVALVLDRPSVYMGGPSKRALRLAEEIIELVRAHPETADAPTITARIHKGNEVIVDADELVKFVSLRIHGPRAADTTPACTCEEGGIMWSSKCPRHGLKPPDTTAADICNARVDKDLAGFEKAWPIRDQLKRDEEAERAQSTTPALNGEPIPAACTCTYVNSPTSASVTVDTACPVHGAMTLRNADITKAPLRGRIWECKEHGRLFDAAFGCSMCAADETAAVDQKTCKHEWTDVARCLVCDLTYDMYDGPPHYDVPASATPAARGPYYVEEMRDGAWIRHATAHMWANEDDARAQCQALRQRYGGKIFRVTDRGTADTRPDALGLYHGNCGVPGCKVKHM